MVTCVGATLAAALVSTTMAHARGFTATGNVVQGAAQITSSATQTQIAVQSKQAVIDWTRDAASPQIPTNPDAPYPFLPAGTSAVFTGSDGAADGYTVLNRILIPQRAGFDGTVTSRVGSAIGGEVWFYNPNGIVVGSGAVFNVGSLVLTANEIDTSGGLYDSTGSIRFRGPPSSRSNVLIRSGASLSAGGSDQAYMAIVAPKIEQNGTLNSSGSIALVAAEQADIRINAGLLDIAITAGTTERNGIIHTGKTGGAVSGLPQTIYMVAVPKNDALTMLLAGDIGYSAASQASIDGTSVVLKAGDAASPVRASMQIGGFGDAFFITPVSARFSSPVTATAATDIDVTPAMAERVDFLSSATLSAGNQIRLAALRQTRITAGDLALSAGKGSGGGTVSVTTRGANDPNAGRIDIAKLGIDVGAVSDLGEASGGSAIVEANGGAISVGQLAIDASAAGPRAIGGDILFRVGASGSIESAVTDLSANGVGVAAASGSADAVGGSITIRALGQMRLAETTMAVTAANQQAGTATAGNVLIDLGASKQRWGSLDIDASSSTGPGALGKAGKISLRLAPLGEFRLDGDFSARAVGGTPDDAVNFDIAAPEALIAIGGSADLAATGAIDLALGGSGAVEVGNALSAQAGSTFSSSGTVAAGSLVVLAGKGILSADLRSTGATTLRAPGGDVVVSRLSSQGPVAAAAEALQISSPGSLDFAEAVATAGDISIGAAESLGLSSASASGRITLSAGSNLTLGEMGGSSITLSTPGNLIASGPFTTPGTIEIGTGGNLQIGALQAASATLNAGGDISTSGPLRVGGLLSFDAEGAVALGGSTVGATIEIVSRDIDIDTGASLGERGTTSSILLGTRSTSRTNIGGIGETGVYSLERNEASRLFADGTITLRHPFADRPISEIGVVTIGDLSLAYGANGNLGSGGALRIQTPADIDVIGAVRLTAASDTDTFALSARTITIDPARAGIAITGGNGALQGRLAISASTIVAANADIRPLIARRANLAEITAALGRPAAAGRTDAYLQAGVIDATVGQGFFVQNSGASSATAARRGFSARTFSITTGDPGALLTLNGVIVDGTGAVIGGRDTAQFLSVNGVPASEARGVNASSSLNGCTLGAAICGDNGPGPLPTPPSRFLPKPTLSAPIETARLIDQTRLPGAPESLSERGGISLLDRNDAFPPGSVPTIPRQPGGSITPDRGAITSGSQPIDRQPPRGEDWSSVVTQGSVFTAVMQRQLSPYLIVTEQQDRYLQNPLIDEPGTGVGNDDLWLNGCIPTEEKPCAGTPQATGE